MNAQMTMCLCEILLWILHLISNVSTITHLWKITATMIADVVNWFNFLELITAVMSAAAGVWSVSECTALAVSGRCYCCVYSCTRWTSTRQTSLLTPTHFLMLFVYCTTLQIHTPSTTVPSFIWYFSFVTNSFLPFKLYPKRAMHWKSDCLCLTRWCNDTFKVSWKNY